MLEEQKGRERSNEPHGAGSELNRDMAQRLLSFLYPFRAIIFEVFGLPLVGHYCVQIVTFKKGKPHTHPIHCYKTIVKDIAYSST